MTTATAVLLVCIWPMIVLSELIQQPFACESDAWTVRNGEVKCDAVGGWHNVMTVVDSGPNAYAYAQVELVPGSKYSVVAVLYAWRVGECAAGRGAQRPCWPSIHVCFDHEETTPFRPEECLVGLYAKDRGSWEPVQDDFTAPSSSARVYFPAESRGYLGWVKNVSLRQLGAGNAKSCHGGLDEHGHDGSCHHEHDDVEHKHDHTHKHVEHDCAHDHAHDHGHNHPASSRESERLPAGERLTPWQTWVLALAASCSVMCTAFVILPFVARLGDDAGQGGDGCVGASLSHADGACCVRSLRCGRRHSRVDLRISWQHRSVCTQTAPVLPSKTKR